MRKTVKLVKIEDKNYLISADQIKVGDSAIVTVGGEYPNVVKCENEMVLNLIVDPKLSLTKAYKIVGFPEQLNITNEELSKIEENQGLCFIDHIEEETTEDKNNWTFSKNEIKSIKVII